MEMVKDLGSQPYGVDTKGRVSKRPMAIFKCEFCNNEFKLRKSHGLKQKSCKDCRGKASLSSHGMAGTNQYHIWQGMRQRCSNNNNKRFHCYGGKGVEVCDKWSTFNGFWEDMEDGYEVGLTLDRIDSNLGYNKENCQWITLSENSAKTNRVRPVIQMDKKHNEIKTWSTAREAALALGLTAGHISAVCHGKRSTHGGFMWKFVQ